MNNNAIAESTAFKMVCLLINITGLTRNGLSNPDWWQGMALAIPSWRGI